MINNNKGKPTMQCHICRAENIAEFKPKIDEQMTDLL
jgi:hypothetical protein